MTSNISATLAAQERIKEIVSARGRFPFGCQVTVANGKTYKRSNRGYLMAWIACNESWATATLQQRAAYKWAIGHEQISVSGEVMLKPAEARGAVIAFLRAHGPATVAEIRKAIPLIYSYENTMTVLSQTGVIVGRRCSHKCKNIWRLTE